MNQTTPPFVDLQALAFSYAKKPIFSALTWHHPLIAGEILAVLGPSGSGKSTLLRLIAGLETPDQGSVSVGGTHPHEIPPHTRKISIVFQERTLFPGTAYQNVSFPLRMRHVPTDEMDRVTRDMFALVGLTGLEQRSVLLLSGGERQRVELARALLARPDLLLLDEPFAQLDIPLRRRLAMDVRSWVRATKTRCIFVTHDATEALIAADAVSFLLDGVLTPPQSSREAFLTPRTIKEALLTGFLNQATSPLPNILAQWPETVNATPPTTAATIAFRPWDCVIAPTSLAPDALHLLGVVSEILVLAEGLVASVRLQSNEHIYAMLRPDQNVTTDEPVTVHLSWNRLMLFDTSGYRVFPLTQNATNPMLPERSR